MPHASTQTDTLPIWKDISFSANSIVFVPNDGYSVASIVAKMDEDYPSSEWEYRIFGNPETDSDARVVVWKIAADDEEDDDDDDDDEDEMEDCDGCGYTHHCEDKCPLGNQTKMYEKWCEAEA